MSTERDASVDLTAYDSLPPVVIRKYQRTAFKAIGKDAPLNTESLLWEREAKTTLPFLDHNGTEKSRIILATDHSRSRIRTRMEFNHAGDDFLEFILTNQGVAKLSLRFTEIDADKLQLLQTLLPINSVNVRYITSIISTRLQEQARVATT